MGIIWRGIKHDMSKLLPSEFIPYARYFYGDGEDANTENAFDYAWLLHQKRNRHHWQWWLFPLDDGGTKVFEMPLDDIREMISDWIGAGIAIAGRSDPLPWYEINKDNIRLNDITRKIVEANLKHISECPEWDLKQYRLT